MDVYQLQEQVLKRGYLTKRGRLIQSWKKRFFVLSNGCLTYYRSPDDICPIGQLSLFGATCSFVRNVSSNHQMHTIAVQTASRILMLQSTDLPDLKEWAILIQKSSVVETSHKGLKREELAEKERLEEEAKVPEEDY